MEYFKEFVSATMAATVNQFVYNTGDKSPQTVRSTYKLLVSGENVFSFLFANQVASTYYDGSECRANRICGEWNIISLKAGVSEAGKEPKEFADVLFDGRKEKTVGKGEMFCTDEIELKSEKGDFLILEMTFSAEEFPYLRENMWDGFSLVGGVWICNDAVPRPVMVGVKRKAKRVAFLGDSITESIGTPKNSYAGYAHKTAENIKGDFAFLNLGIGYGRCADVATDGLWMELARQSDAVVMCFGVNDICMGVGNGLGKNINHVINRLHKSGCKVLLQTVPPFDLSGDSEKTRNEINEKIKSGFFPADAVFDNGPILAPNGDGRTLYGGHPDITGCEIWGRALAEFIEKSHFLDF